MKGNETYMSVLIHRGHDAAREDGDVDVDVDVDDAVGMWMCARCYHSRQARKQVFTGVEVGESVSFEGLAMGDSRSVSRLSVVLSLLSAILSSIPLPSLLQTVTYPSYLTNISIPPLTPQNDTSPPPPKKGTV